MLPTANPIKAILLLIAIVFCAPQTNAQLLKKLKKRAERTVERKLEQKVEKETSKGMDSILDPDDKSNKKEYPDLPSVDLPNDSPKTIQGNNQSMEDINSNISDDLEVYSKFDFVPGDKQLFFDDFSQDFIGDFPSKWNTNATGEVVKINNVVGNWFELKSGYGVFYVPDVKDLPEDYTIEFDVLAQGIGRETSSTARMYIILSDSNEFNNGTNHYAQTEIPFGQYGAFSLRVKNYFNRGVGAINTDIKADIRDEVLNKPHISISVTKNRYRLWINEVKYVDIPRFIQELDVLKYLKFHINNFKDGQERIFISNLKVAEGGVDLRRQLISKGKISTNGILFDSGSANIQPQSLGIVRQISQVLMQDKNINLLIVGHTDADGTDDTNLKLSKARAEAVKSALIDIYKISGDRLTTDGKGESVPVSDNSTNEGKAENRRVEFVKQ